MARCFASSFKVTSARGSRHKLDLLLDPRTDDWDQGTCTPLVRRLYRRAIRESHDDHITVRSFPAPRVGPQIEHIMEVDVGQQWRGTSALGRPFLHSHSFPLLQHA